MNYERGTIEKKIRENENIFTFLFESSKDPLPGQFAMVWIPGIDEMPMSYSYVGKKKGITFKVVGEGTRKLSLFKEGDYIFLRGPYGTHYTEEGENALFVAGGTGISSLAPFIELSNFKRKKLIIGAKTSTEIYFLERLKNYLDEILIFTEDGSLGKKGLVTDGLSSDIDIIYSCGPEKMVKKVLDFSAENRINLQASLERMMKCGIGICDSCSINGFRVCIDGPVFKKSDLLKMIDLGKYGRLPSGKKVIL